MVAANLLLLLLLLQLQLRRMQAVMAAKNKAAVTARAMACRVKGVCLPHL